MELTTEELRAALNEHKKTGGASYDMSDLEKRAPDLAREVLRLRGVVEALAQGVDGIEREYETEYDGRMYFICGSCGSQDDQPHSPDCDWPKIDAALTAYRPARAGGRDAVSESRLTDKQSRAATAMAAICERPGNPVAWLVVEEVYGIKPPDLIAASCLPSWDGPKPDLDSIPTPELRAEYLKQVAQNGQNTS